MAAVLSDVLTTVTQVGVLAFVVASMAAMGLGLTVDRIVEPLRNVRVVVLLLLVNFVAVPAAAIAAARLLPVEQATGTALVIYGCCAGAPFLPKLAQLAKGDVALAVGAMVLLMVVTVVYAPIVLPLAVEGATVDAGRIASSLVLFMLVPLGVALVVRARYPELAAEWVGPAGLLSTTALLIGVSAGLFVSWREIVGAIGSWIFIGMVILILTALITGYLAGYGGAGGTMRVTMLGTAQRNISAALVVAGSLGGDVVVLTLVGGLAIILALLVIAGEIGRRASASQPGETRPSAVDAGAS
jgi:predicted Na+-dependent transporter